MLMWLYMNTEAPPTCEWQPIKGKLAWGEAKKELNGLLMAQFKLNTKLLD